MLHPSLILIIPWEWGVWDFCQQVQLLTLPLLDWPDRRLSLWYLLFW